MGKGKSITISTEDVLWAAGGALAGLAVNPVLNKAVATMPQQTRDLVGKALPAAKVLGGGAIAVRRKTPRNWKLFGLGLAGAGGIELGVKFQPICSLFPVRAEISSH